MITNKRLSVCEALTRFDFLWANRLSYRGFRRLKTVKEIIIAVSGATLEGLPFLNS